MNNRVKTLLQRHGNDFFSRIGKKGFQVTCDRYFGGDREAMKRWLVDMGNYSIYSGLSFHKPEIEHWPGPHPAHIQQERAWLEYVEAAISPNFPPFSNDRADCT